MATSKASLLAKIEAAREREFVDVTVHIERALAHAEELPVVLHFSFKMKEEVFERVKAQYEDWHIERDGLTDPRDGTYTEEWRLS